ncbi:NAD-dependent epimerase/dehydratase family protein [Candidatus Woesearchaeota archaeon]|nr:NAD-dependent epimerase/dehydratase family protein [Candidatus Woesearchaeota archaeon]
MSKNILITGGLGFIGSNLAEECVDCGYKVVLLSKTTSKIENIRRFKDKVSLIIKDVRDIDREVVGFDWIFHLAGTTNNYHVLNDPYLDINMNCVGTIALLEACRKNNPSVRIVYGSTFFVNGNARDIPVEPNTPCKPLGLYGATRLAGEHFCRIYNNVFDMNALIARFTNVFGIREQTKNKKKAGFTYLINLALGGEEIPLYSNGNFYRDYIYISDVVKACLIMAKSGEKSKVYYVGRGEFIKFREIMDLVIHEVGKGTIKPIEPPDFHKRVGITNFVCDNSELKKLGWSPQVTLKEGIRRTVDFYRNNT